MPSTAIDRTVEDEQQYDEDDEVQFVEEKKSAPAAEWPHARYDCIVHPMDSGDPAVHCEHCWCCICQTPVAKCTEWRTHCSKTAADDRAHSSQARATALRAKLQAAPLAEPPPPGSEIAELQLDFRFLQWRHTALVWLSNCGADDPAAAQDGVLCALQFGCEIPLELATRVLAVLRATMDVLELEGCLHLRPDAPLTDEPPPPGPPGPQLHQWLELPDVEAPTQAQQLVHAKTQMQAVQQQQVWASYFALMKAHAARMPGGAPWLAYYEQQERAKGELAPQFMAQLVKAWTRHYAQGGR